MRCESCKHFIKTYEGEGWCSHPKYSGIVLTSFNQEICRGNGYVRGSEPVRIPQSAAEETPRKP
jgi:hypothetical protein